MRGGLPARRCCWTGSICAVRSRAGCFAPRSAWSGLVVFAVVTAGVWPGFADAWAENEVAGVPGDFSFIVWPFKLLVVVGAAATAIEFAVQLVRNAIAGIDAWRDAGHPAIRGPPRLGLALPRSSAFVRSRPIRCRRRS